MSGQNSIQSPCFRNPLAAKGEFLKIHYSNWAQRLQKTKNLKHNETINFKLVLMKEKSLEKTDKQRL